MTASSLHRRSFLGLGLASAAAAACAKPKPGAVPVSAAGQGTGPWAALRGEFLLSQDKVHLSNLLIASNPRVVREAMQRFRQGLDEDPVGFLEHDFETQEYTNATLDAAAKYMQVTRAQIALTDSTTSGLAVVYGGLVIGRGEEIITTAHDHFVTHESLRLTAERTGAVVRKVDMYEDGAKARADTMANAVTSAITAATRVIAITWVHSGTGVRTPVRAIADAVRKVNASRSASERILLCVDGVHGFGVEDVTMADLDCDFFVAGCHKWIWGPRGTGLVWGRSDAWPRVRPVACPFAFDYVMAREYGKGQVPPVDGRVNTPGGFRAFENRWALAESFKLHLEIGKANIAARIHELAQQLKVGMGAMKHVTLHTPMAAELSAAIVTFEVAGMTPDAVVKKLLASKIVATTTPYIPTYARFTPGVTNTPEEIERALAAVRALA